MSIKNVVTTNNAYYQLVAVEQMLYIIGTILVPRKRKMAYPIPAWGYFE